MTTLYRDSRHDYLVIYSRVDESLMAQWKVYADSLFEKDEEEGYWKSLQQWLDWYSECATPQTFYYRRSVVSSDLIGLFPPDKAPVSAPLVSYRRYQLNEDTPMTYKESPFSLTHCRLSDGLHPYENYRMEYVYDQNPNQRFREYTALICIQRDEGLQGGNLILYPQYDEENTMSSILSQLAGECSLPRKELEIPFPPGSMVLLSGETWYAMEPLRGKGTCIVMMVDFLCES